MKRTVFYPVLAGMFLLFFLLHWNGMFDFTYWWALERVNGTHSFLPQFVAALLSAVIIFSVPVLLFEWRVRSGGQTLESAEPAESSPPGRFPAGMTILCVYLGYSALTNLPRLALQEMYFGPFVFGKSAIICSSLISFFILTLCLYGVLKRTGWARPTILGWCVLGILCSLTDFVLVLRYKAESLAVFQVTEERDLLLPKLAGVALVLIVNTVVCWYVYSRKDFFTTTVQPEQRII